MAALCASKAMFVKPEKNQFGFNLTHDEGLDTFSAKVDRLNLGVKNVFIRYLAGELGGAMGL